MRQPRNFFCQPENAQLREPQDEQSTATQNVHNSAELMQASVASNKRGDAAHSEEAQLSEAQATEQMRALALHGGRVPLSVAVRRCVFHWFHSTQLEAEVLAHQNQLLAHCDPGLSSLLRQFAEARCWQETSLLKQCLLALSSAAPSEICVHATL